MIEDDIREQFRNNRYESLNACRWAHFLSLGISLEGRTIFEPGAGIGDQTEWLLSQGVKHIYVNDCRFHNLAMIHGRFGDDPRLTLIAGDLEVCLTGSQFAKLNVDFIFCYGVYYHLRESAEFRIMRELASTGQTIAFDFLAGNDNEVSYGYDNPSTSLSTYGFRPRPESLMAVLKEIWGFAYLPREQLRWVDPVQSEQRLVAVASHAPLHNENLILQ